MFVDRSCWLASLSQQLRERCCQVSGQLNGEYYACAMTNIYTFGPTFRAENSHTVRLALKLPCTHKDLAADWRLAAEPMFEVHASKCKSFEHQPSSRQGPILCSAQARHLAEFVMIEPEMAWCDLQGVCSLCSVCLHLRQAWDCRILAAV